MDKIAAQTWFSCSIYYSRSEVLYEILGNVKNSEFVGPKQQLHIFSCLNTKLSCFPKLNLVLIQKLTPGMAENPKSDLVAGWESDPKCPTQVQSALADLESSPCPCTGEIIWYSDGAGASASLSSSEDSESLDHLECPWLGGHAMSIRHLPEPHPSTGEASGHFAELQCATCIVAVQEGVSEPLPSWLMCTQK